MAPVDKRVHRYYVAHRALNWAATVFERRFLPFIRVLFAITIAVIAGVITIVTTDLDRSAPEVIAPLLAKIHEYQFAILLALLFAQYLVQLIGTFASHWPRPDSAKLERILNTLVAEVFPNQDRGTHQYRATLFKARSFPMLGSWLGMVARSGHMYPKKRTIFSICHDRKRYNTGICGECWKRDDKITIKLPDCRLGPKNKQAIEAYKLAGYLDDREYATMQVPSCVVIAIGIRIAGKVHGVLVLDSTDEAAYPVQPEDHTAVLALAAVATEQFLA